MGLAGGGGDGFLYPPFFHRPTLWLFFYGPNCHGFFLRSFFQRILFLVDFVWWFMLRCFLATQARKKSIAGHYFLAMKGSGESAHGKEVCVCVCGHLCAVKQNKFPSIHHKQKPTTVLETRARFLVRSPPTKNRSPSRARPRRTHGLCAHRPLHLSLPRKVE
jgi:hypothetical protein